MFFALRDTIIAVAWSPSSTLLGAIGIDGNFLVCHPKNHVRQWTYDETEGGDYFPLKCMSWFPDVSRKRELIALGGTSGMVTIWDVRAGKMLTRYQEHSPEVDALPAAASPIRRALRALAWSPNKRVLASVAQDAVPRIWNTHTGKTQFVAGQEPLRAESLLAWVNEHVLATSFHGPEVVLWEASTGRVVQTIKTHGSQYPASTCALSPGCTHLAVANRTLLSTYDVTTGVQEAAYEPTFSTHATYGYTNAYLAWSPDERFIAVCFTAANQRILIWSPQRREIVQEVISQGPITCLDWSPDGRQLGWGGFGYLETVELLLPS